MIMKSPAVFAAVPFAACAAVAPDPVLGALPADAAQAVVVRATAAGRADAAWQAWERARSGWRAVGDPVACVVGRGGVVDAAHKREGDGGTPAGAWPLRRAFGAAAELATGLQYVATTADDHWVDDPQAPQYNQWVVGAPGVSAERLQRADGQYDVAAVLEYNTDPVVPGKGSAIFLHVWGGPGQPTAGCVAAAAADVRALLGWLDRARRPVCVVLPAGD
jgi:L,D-peptidoglycan transpeptidase YkuD (ErfK/YbiS/YcfS/YnhG family)